MEDRRGCSSIYKGTSQREIKEMRILIDSNVVISYILSIKSPTGIVVEHIRAYNTVVLTQYVINEVRKTIIRKFPSKLIEAEMYIDILPDEYYDFGGKDTNKYPNNRDKKDIPILANAIESKVDILFTGDKDFDEIKIDKPRIMTPRQYYDEFMI